MKVLLIGPLSNIGGVNVHLTRLILLLRNKNIDFLFIDDSSSRPGISKYANLRNPLHFFLCIKQLLKSDVVHIHSGNWILRLILVLFTYFVGKKTIVTIHSFRINGIKKKLSLKILRLVNLIIIVNKEMEIAFSYYFRNLIMKEAFIPPFLEEENELPSEIVDLLKLKVPDNILICANAFKLTPYNGKELYGLDQCLTVARMFKERKMSFFIFFVVGNPNKNYEYINSFKAKLVEERLEDFIHIIPQSISFISLIKKCDIVLRPTLSDGDALTVREALYYRKVVIASDIVKRPNDVILYKTGDSTDLFDKIRQFSKMTIGREIAEGTSLLKDEAENFYYNLYKSCYNSPKN